MEVVLNEHTGTVHKPRVDEPEYHTVCGITRNLTHDEVQVLPFERAASDHDASKCGRCFEDGGGY